jgi:hypothetical protein
MAGSQALYICEEHYLIILGFSQRHQTLKAKQNKLCLDTNYSAPDFVILYLTKSFFTQAWKLGTQHMNIFG